MNKKTTKTALSLIGEIEISPDAHNLLIPLVEVKIGKTIKKLWLEVKSEKSSKRQASREGYCKPFKR